MRFSRPEYWRQLPFPSPGDLSNPGIRPVSPALAGGLFITEPPRKPLKASQPGQKKKRETNGSKSLLVQTQKLSSKDQANYCKTQGMSCKPSQLRPWVGVVYQSLEERRAQSIQDNEVSRLHSLRRTSRYIPSFFSQSTNGKKCSR